MTNNFVAVLKKCNKCGEKYIPIHQSAECPHKPMNLIIDKLPLDDLKEEK